MEGSTYAAAVNSRGIAVGTAYNTFVTYDSVPFVYNIQDKSSLVLSFSNPFYPAIQSSLPHSTPLYPVGGEAYAINEAGQIVGSMFASLNNKGIEHAFLSNGANTQDLNALIGPGSSLVLNAAVSINDRGQIVGYGTDGKGNIHEVLLTPLSTPEPNSMILCGTMLGIVIMAHRKSVSVVVNRGKS